VIDFATNRAVRRVLQRRWFGPAVFIGYQLARKLYRNFVYQPFIKPFHYLRRRPARHRPVGRWVVPTANVAAMRHRGVAIAAAGESVAVPGAITGPPAG
jgi:hypothetical protein